MLSKRIILITGASSGIGEACAYKLGKLGAKIILLARRIEKLKSIQNNLAHHNIEALPIECDVQDVTAVNNIINNLPEHWQHIDILINNAGLAKGSESIQTGVLKNWDTMIDTNIKGLLYVTHTILPIMIRRNTGHIINIGSIAGQSVYENGNVYCASKHAVRALTQSMRIDLLNTGIKVTEIAPGAVATEFSAVRWQDADRAKEFYSSFIPLQAEDVADAIAYALLTPSHVNISEITLMSTSQASVNHISRRT